VVTQFVLQSGADLSVCYDYTPPVVPFCFGDGSGTACPCGNASAVGAGAGCLGSTGQGAKLSSSGLASVGNDTFVLVCTGLPATATAVFIQGGSQQNGGAGSVFGDGLRCAGMPVVRVHIVRASGGIATYPQGGQTAISVLGGVVPNALRHYQTWYRNAASFCTPSTFNLSQGLTVTWSL